MHRPVLSLLIGLLTLPAFASNPGEPLDCSDWVFLEPGLSCVMIEVDCENPTVAFDWCVGLNRTQMLTTGQLVRMDSRAFSPPRPCNSNHVENRVELFTLDDDGVRVLAGMEDRCLPDGRVDKIRGPHGVIFDPNKGDLYFSLFSHCDFDTSTQPCEYTTRRWVGKITGFTTTLEILEDQFPEGPPGPPGPPGDQGPPGPLIPACPDADGDAWADCSRVPVCNPYGHPCGDCDDGDSTVNPGASEGKPSGNKHDGKDNDCNGQIDDF